MCPALAYAPVAETDQSDRRSITIPIPALAAPAKIFLQDDVIEEHASFRGAYSQLVQDEQRKSNFCATRSGVFEGGPIKLENPARLPFFLH